MFECQEPSCRSKPFKTMSRFEAHLRSHEGVQMSFKCKENGCRSRPFKSAARLNDHVQRKHRNALPDRVQNDDELNAATEIAAQPVAEQVAEPVAQPLAQPVAVAQPVAQPAISFEPGQELPVKVVDSFHAMIRWLQVAVPGPIAPAPDANAIIAALHEFRANFAEQAADGNPVMEEEHVEELQQNSDGERTDGRVNIKRELDEEVVEDDEEPAEEAADI